MNENFAHIDIYVWLWLKLGNDWMRVFGLNNWLLMVHFEIILASHWIYKRSKSTN